MWRLQLLARGSPQRRSQSMLCPFRGLLHMAGWPDYTCKCASVRWLQERDSKGTNNVAFVLARGPGEEADFGSVVHARSCLLQLVGRGFPVWVWAPRWLSSFCLTLQYDSTSKGFVLVGPCGFLVGDVPPSLSSLSYLPLHDNLDCQDSVRCHHCCHPLVSCPVDRV